MQIWAHRGASAAHPENTLAAFCAAAAADVHGVEFDVQLTADSIPVVIHDEKVDRTHDGSGWVRDHRLADLQRLPSRLVKRDRRNSPQFRIPTLAEVLDVFAPSALRINVELKNSVKAYKGMEEAILDHLAERSLGERAVLSSFNHYSLQRLREIGWTGELAAVHDGLLREPWRYLRELDVQAVHPPRQALVVPGYVTRAHRAGFAVRVWTVNRSSHRERCRRLGVDGIFTDVV